MLIYEADMLTLMYITNNPDVALIAQKYGVDRIWIDLEYKGKEERQKGLNSVKSKHTVQDIKNIAPLITTSKLLVRINPWDNDSVAEIEAVISAGADMIMLPMWKSVSEVTSFLNAVKGRVPVILLLETKEAVNCLDEVLQLSGIDEIHIGLNDLHLSYGYKFMFEPLADGLVESIINKISASGIPYGFGGIARIGEGMLPAESIIMEHYRLKSSMVILSRSFCNAEATNDISEIEKIFSVNLKKLRQFENSISDVNHEHFNQNLKTVKSIVNKITSRI